ncbi:acyl transferase domain-containing protein [Allocatelliglobosispora scoriae]|uniref:Acyl transferase domain-containing protein n=1 Tax=Allocatelliglobosispora scoriae TaxID=643052 RepID=A0A841C356_9ACTN|nr:type I polyketide synthase [Allocatelliglobosispora scoriae]MBB5873482.1 acyl transferase domain-containing protein [Allocatelliglobosispora scoriae]
MSDQTESDFTGTSIAIVGMSGRFPGAADVAELWANIRAGISGITRFTDEELRAAGVPDELIADPAYVKANPVIEGIDLFDAGFFGVGPKEAQILDPQQRLYLEHNWQALEDAGCDPTRFDGTIGVFGGSAWSSYLQNNLAPSGIASVMGDLAVGLANDKDSLTTRVAHTLGLTGPSYSVQSYCSTSLVAVCAAATSLANFECDMALAGGVNVAVPHNVGYLYQQGGIAPPDAECRAFDAAGLGSPVGSGVGVVALRRLEDAIADGDRVYAVIRGWAINNDGGRKVGFTAPGVQGQAAVIAEAQSSADLSAADIDYVEAHGTGTALGDAAELAALQQVFHGEECLIGSIKTNVGHLDRAAGVTSLIKTALALRNEEIPPTRNLADPNHQLRTGEARLEVVTSLREWPRNPDRIRRAGVSSFGIGGTNAHVVLEEAPLPTRADLAPRPELLVWSARTAAAADEMTGRLADHLDVVDERIGDVAHTLQSGRRLFEHRRVVVAATAAEAAAGIRGAKVLAQADGRTDRQVAFLLAGTGEQYPGMAADLHETEPVFRAALQECRAILTERLGGIDPLAEMLSPRSAGDADGSGLSWLLGRATPAAANTGDATDRLQPATFAVEYALAQLLLSWGIRPSLMAGYSLGEYVAACLAGVLTLDDALALVAFRAQLINELPAGAMAAVPLAEAELRSRIERAQLTGVDIAAVNGPELTIVSGEPDELARLRALLEADAVPCRPLATTHAFHSRMLEPIRTRLTEWVAANIRPSAPQIPYVSNVTGTLATAEQVTDPGYWAEHMCAAVRFDASLATVIAQGDLALLEIGPGQSLGAMARGRRDYPQDRWRLVVPTLPAAADPRPASAALAEAVGRLWLAGVPIDWAGYQQDRPVAKVGLPGYAFQRERYWIDAPAGGARPAARQVAPQQQQFVAVSRDEHVALLSPQWTVAAIAGAALPVDRCVLVTSGPDPLAAALADALRAGGAEVAAVADDADRATLTARLQAQAPTLVVDLRALAQAGAGGSEAVLPLAGLVDALGSDAATDVRLVVATRGGQAVLDGERPVPGHAAVGAMPVVVNQEYLNIESRTVDLDPAADTAAIVTALAAELGHTAQDVIAAYRNGSRYVRDFAAAAADGTGVSVRRGGTYLITGGLGDVGLLVGEHLVRAGAARIVLTSRAGLTGQPGDRRFDAVTGLRALGAEVLTPAVDVTDLDQMRALVTGLDRLDGVVHAAAQTGPETFRPLRDLDTDTVDRHFGAKVTGARVLADLIAELPAESAPAFALLFSSTSSILGGLAFGSYTAANAALTAIGQQHRNTATRWIAASWDTWAATLEKLEGGMGASMLAHSMSKEEALAAFDRLLAVGLPSLVVAAAGLTDRLPRLNAEPDAPVASGSRFPRPDLPQPYSPPLTATERALAEVWSEVLGVEPVGTRDNFFDLSGNSLLGLQMLALVKKRFGVAIPSVTLFEAPTVTALAAILDQQGAVIPAQAGAPVVVAAAARKPATVALRSQRLDTGVDVDRRIAVVGMAGRFPGASDVSAFWQNLRDGVESISFFSEEELLASGVSPELIRDPSYVPARPVLDDVAGFDPAFFGISPRMAALTDPQQRMFLEVCWEALEQSGYAAAEHRGRVGVYGGSNISTYLLQMPEETITNGDVSTYEIIMGNDKDALTTTVSYLFDLYGPSVAVQTFCSTSLVATHLAMQSLRNGECELAIAGGVSIRVPEKVGHVFGPGGMESPDGHVRTFDAQAKGSMFGDGAAVVVLKRLSDALRDGDHIWSVIRGSAINNDGALKVGYTAPSVVGQARVISDALADAGVTGEDISYIEAHGTATELGDPIELAALTRAFGPTEENQYCPIGSVKTNIGHLDRAAGVTGLIKTSLALRDQVIPASLHYTSPNPDIDFENSPFYVNTELTPWRARDGRTPMAGINSLGMGGTNVHVVVEQAPTREFGDAGDEPTRRFQVVPVSARNATAADQAVTRLADHLKGAPGIRLIDLAYTLQVGRKTFEHRRVLTTDSTADAAAVLGGETPGRLLTRIDTVKGRQVAFLLTGVGEQYPGMAGELYRREPVFRAALDECLAALSPLLPEVDLLDLLTGERGAGADLASLLGRGTAAADPRVALLERTEVVQPALFAIEYALASTLITWGVQPRVLLGYSLGEYVAACLAGVLSLPDALRLVAHRAKLIEAVDPGAMVAVPLSPEELTAKFKLAKLGVDIAAVNGPKVTVVAGPIPAIEAFVAALRKAEIASRPLQTTHAFHSRMLAQVGPELTEWVRANITLHEPELPYISNVTGGYADADLVCDPGYWAAHMAGTVQFATGIETLLGDPQLAIVEIGPGQSLGALIRSAGAPPQRWPMILSTLPAASDSRPDDAVVTDCLARLWLLGVEPDWLTYHDRHDGAQVGDPAALPGRIPLPTYPFQRQKFWIEGTRASKSATAGHSVAAVEGDGPSLATLDAIEGLAKLPEDQWHYLPVWRQTAAPAPAAAQPASWLVYTRDGVADEVVTALAKVTTANIRLVRPGEGYATGPDGYTILPGSVDDTLALLRDLRKSGQPLERVLHLWSLGPALGETIVADGMHTLVALARAAGELGMDSWSLDAAVSGTQQVLAGDVANPYAATVTGPCRVIPLEYPTIATRLIDLDADPGATAVAALVTELQRPLADPVVALRHGRRWLPGYDPMPTITGDDRAVLREGGVYLITGGLGGIALGMAEQLATDCRAKLVLLARSGLPARAEWPGILAAEPAEGNSDKGIRARIARVVDLEQLGAEVEIVVGDVSSPDDVRRAVDIARERFGALHGVLHVAGVPGMGLMQFKRPEELDLVLAPKVGGTLAIADALRIGKPDEVELDFLVLFSSITSTTGGGPGQVDYCAANAFLDSYAYQLADTGRRVLSVNWGEWTWNAWTDGLAGYADSLQEFFQANRARIGIGFADGWRSLLRALATGEPRLVVSTQDFASMIKFSAYFTVDAVTSQALAPGGGVRHPRPELVTSYQEPSTDVEEAIAAIWCESLCLERVGVQDNFFELGGNSLLGVNIVAAIRTAFDLVELPPHILYEAPTVATLGLVVEKAASGETTGSATAENDDNGSHVRAQLRRSGLETSAGRRRGR